MSRKSKIFSKAFNALFCVAFAAQPVVQAHADDLTPDSSSSSRPGIISAPNGVPIQNIVKPSASGLSHNKFRRFNVGKEGLILNNSAKIGTSKLGGVILGNANLGSSGAAKIILNEVTSSNRSQLLGPTEVHGSAAQYIVANPNGITCNGCGFINIPRATLTTGVPKFASGRLAGFTVDKGTVTIGPNGADAETTDYFDIVSRAAKINGIIRGGRELGIFTGRNEFDYAAREATARSDDGSKKPEFGIDSSELGGMYAGRIKLVGTETGVGVRLPKSSAATTGDFRITADGKLELGSVSARRKVVIKSNNNQVAVGRSARIYGGETLSIKAGRGIVVAKQSVLGARNDVTLDAERIDYDGDVLFAGLKADGSLAANSGKLTIRSIAETAIATDSLLRGGSGVDIDTGSLTLSGQLYSDQKATFNVDSLSVTGSNSLISAKAVNLDADRSVVVGTRSEGILADQVLQLTSTGLQNDASIFAGQSAVLSVAGDISNSGTIQSGGEFLLSANDLLNQQSGKISSASDLTLTLADVENSGVVSSSASITINAAGFSQTASGSLIAETQLSADLQSLVSSGTVAAGSTLSITTSGNAELRAGGYIQAGANAGIAVGGKLTVASSDPNRAASLYSVGALTLSATDGLILSDAASAISSAETLSIESAQLINAGKLLSSDALTIVLSNRAKSSNSETGVIQTDGALNLSGAGFDNAGAMLAVGDLTLQLSGGFNNIGVNSVVATNGAADISALSLRNEGAMESSGKLSIRSANGDLVLADGSRTRSTVANVSLDAAGKLTANGLLIAKTNLDAKANDNVTVGGGVSADGSTLTLSSNTGQLKVDADGIVSSADELFLSAASITNDGIISGKSASLTTTVGALENKKGATLQTVDGDLEMVSASALTNNGQIVAIGSANLRAVGAFSQADAEAALRVQDQLTLSASSITNNGEISSSGSATLTSRGTTSNLGSGTITANGEAILQSDGLFQNDGAIVSNDNLSLTSTANFSQSSTGAVSALGTLSLQAAGIRNSGAVEANGAVDVAATSADVVNTADGLIRSYATSDTLVPGQVGLTVSAQNTINNSGSIYGADDLKILAGVLSNLGDLEALGDLILQTSGATSVDNLATVFAGGTLSATVGSLSVGGEVESGDDLTVTAAGNVGLLGSGSLQSNEDIGITGGGSLSLGGGSFIYAANLSANVDAVNNSGELGGIESVDLVVKNSLNNRSGGAVLSNGTLDVDAKSLTNSGTVAASGNANVIIKQALNNRASGDVNSNAILTVSAASLSNNGKLSGSTGLNIATPGDVSIGKTSVWQALGGVFTLTARDITNVGVLASGGDLIIRSRSLTNDNALVLANNNLTIEGRTAGARSNRLINKDGGAIETLNGDIRIRTQDLQNLSTVTTAVERNDYFNRAVISLVPSWLVPGSKDFRNYPIYSSYISRDGWEQLNDKGQVSGYLFIPHPDVIAEILEAENATPDQWNPDWWQTYGPTSLATFDPSKGDLERWALTSPDEAYRIPSGGGITVRVEQEYVTAASSTSRIATGSGDIFLDVGSFDNQQSIVTANGDLRIDGGSLNNEGVSLSRTTSVLPSGWSFPFTRSIGWVNPRSSLTVISSDTVQAAPGIIHATGRLSGNLSGGLSNVSGNAVDFNDLSFASASSGIVATNVDGVSALSSINGSSPLAPNAVVPGLGSLDNIDFGNVNLGSAATLRPETVGGGNFLRAIGLTSNTKLFATAPRSSPFLIETRFEFVDVASFYGAQYFADAVGIPDTDSLTRIILGDAYFDTRLVQDQIFAATGQRYLADGFTSDAAQMKALIDNAAVEAKALNLTYGVALSKDQISRLTSDIVWFETIKVGGKNVLVPRLYLSDNSKINRSGAVIAAANIDLSAANVLNERGRIEARQSVSLTATDTLVNRSGLIRGPNVALQARDITIETIALETGNGTSRVGSLALEQAVVTADENLSIISSGATVLRGAAVSSAGILNIQTGGDLLVTGLEQNSVFQQSGRGVNVKYEVASARTSFLGSSLQAGTDLSVVSQGGIRLEGALVASDGTVSLQAQNDIDITSLTESTYNFSNYNKKGFLTKGSLRTETASTTNVGSFVTSVGDMSIVSQAGSLEVSASALSSTADLSIEAAQDVTFSAGQDTFESSQEKKSSGLFTSLTGGTFSIGYKKEKHTYDVNAVTQVTSSATGENISIIAGRDFNSEAANFVADNDLSIETGRDINLKSVQDLYTNAETHKVKTIALTVGVFENLSGPLQTLSDVPRMATSGRGNLGYQAISAVSAGLKAVDAINQLNDIAQGGTAAGVTIGLGISSEESSSTESSAIARTTNLSAGGDLNLNAGRDIVSQGSSVDVEGNATLSAGRDIRLESAVNTTGLEGNNSSRSAGISLTLGVGLGGPSASVGINFAAQDGEYERLETFHTNTEIAVGGNLDLTSGRDTTLAGAVINAGSATVDVGRDLTIISQVDTVEGSNDSRGFNAGISVGIGSGSIGFSAGVNGATGDESRVWVADPSGITTEGALDVDVVRGTAITGGVIASLSGDLTLETETLETADIALKDDQSSASGSLGVNIGANSQGVSKPGITVEGAYSNSEVDGVAKATIGEGEITVRSQSDEETDEQLANLNRDPNDVVEITNVKDEGFELYLSDTAVREVFDGLPTVVEALRTATATLRERIRNGLGRQLTDAEEQQIIECVSGGECSIVIQEYISAYGLEGSNGSLRGALETLSPGTLARIEAIGVNTLENSDSRAALQHNLEAFWLAYQYAGQQGDPALQREIVQHTAVLLGEYAAFYRGGGLDRAQSIYSALPTELAGDFLTAFDAGAGSGAVALAPVLLSNGQTSVSNFLGRRGEQTAGTAINIRVTGTSGNATNNGASNIAAAQRLANDLRLASASSPFRADGKLTPSAIDQGRQIIPAGSLGNPNIPAGFGKYESPTFQSPSGDFKLHYYYNPTTKRVFYDLDYKVIFNHQGNRP